MTNISNMPYKQVDKYNPPIEAIKARGWQVAPLIVITVGEWGGHSYKKH